MATKAYSGTAGSSWTASDLNLSAMGQESTQTNPIIKVSPGQVAPPAYLRYTLYMAYEIPLSTGMPVNLGERGIRVVQLSQADGVWSPQVIFESKAVRRLEWDSANGEGFRDLIPMAFGIARELGKDSHLWLAFADFDTTVGTQRIAVFDCEATGMTDGCSAASANASWRKHEFIPATGHHYLQPGIIAADDFRNVRVTWYHAFPSHEIQPEGILSDDGGGWFNDKLPIPLTVDIRNAPPLGDPFMACPAYESNLYYGDYFGSAFLPQTWPPFTDTISAWADSRGECGAFTQAHHVQATIW